MEFKKGSVGSQLFLLCLGQTAQTCHASSQISVVDEQSSENMSVNALRAQCELGGLAICAIVETACNPLSNPYNTPLKNPLQGIQTTAQLNPRHGEGL